MLSLEQYTDKSIAVFGDTKAWSTHLKALGGKFNMNLRGQAGWIFPKTKELEIANFIEQTKILPAPTTPITTPSPRLSIPPPSMTTFMSPDQAISRLKLAVEKRPSETKPSQVNYPNIFTGADNRKYQVVILTLNLPELGQKIKFNDIEKTITEVPESFPIVNFMAEDVEVKLVKNAWMVDNYEVEFL